MHDLRHSHASLLIEMALTGLDIPTDLENSHSSLLIEMGQPILLISERLGHESVDTTWNTYAHLYPNKGVQLADELQKLKIEPNQNHEEKTTPENP